MPIRARIDFRQRVVTIVLDGVVTDEDVRRLRSDLVEEPDFDPHFDHLVDMTAVERVEVSLELRMALVESSIFGKESRRALVAARPLQIGFARQHALMYSDEGSADRVRVFASREEAESWLGLA